MLKGAVTEPVLPLPSGVKNSTGNGAGHHNQNPEEKMFSLGQLTPFFYKRKGQNEVIEMTGMFYEMDEWLQLISKKDTKEMSEGARWWLSRIKAKAENS